MKKIVSLLLAAATCFTFAACNRQGPAETTTAATTTGQNTEPVDPSEVNSLKTADTEGTETFKNPLLTCRMEKAWRNYGFGDPFVMRWNGKYYLYPSTKDGERGIQVWTSDDLVNWEYGGLCAKDRVVTGAYAPEVTYYNGYFYMVTSPAGQGHYTLRSTSPLGPFEVVTGNWGHSIDGHIFIDNNGKWYFYSANGAGIKVYPMSSPTEVSDAGTDTGAYMEGWTEGPMVIYYDGVYYMTYTGNHVWSKGYRIEYATSTRNPLTFKEGGNSPLLVSTEDNCYGIGHNSLVMGPNLDSFYIVYHTTDGKVPQRDTRIDRLVLNGTYMEVLGPTTDNQQKPEMPDVYSYFTTGSDISAWDILSGALSDTGLVLSAGGRALSNDSFGKRYTIEANLLSISGSNAGIIFGYKDDNNYGKVVFDTEKQQLVVTFVINGTANEQRKDLVKSFKEDYNFNALQMLTVRRDGDSYEFLVNNRPLIKATESGLGNGRSGVVAEGGATIGFTGIVGDAYQSSLRKYYKPISGSLEAITCFETKYEDNARFNTSHASLVTSADKYYNYTVNVSAAGKYDLTFKYKSEEEVTLEIYQNGKLLKTVTLPSTAGKEAAYIEHDVGLEAGLGMISFHYLTGSATVTKYDFVLSAEVTPINNDFGKNKGTPVYSDDKWTVSGGKLVLGGELYGKILYGNKGWCNYTVSADITPSDGNINLGIVFRATNPSTGNSGNLKMGNDYYEGYSVMLVNDGLVLGKVNYKWNDVKRYKVRINNNQTYNLKIQVEDATIKVWLDGELVIEYTDANPYTHGLVGFRGYESAGAFDNFTVTPG